MSRRRISIEVDGTIFAIRGWQAHGLALGAGLRPTFSGVRGAWIADTKRLPDLVAYLGYRNVDVEIVGTFQPPVGKVGLEDGPAGLPVGLDEDELDLFGGGGDAA